MTATRDNYREILEDICTSVISEYAPEVDRDGAFPGHSIAALKEARLLGAVSAPEVGGLGLGHRGAAAIVERVARECGSTAMVVTMHFSGTAVLEAHAPETIRAAAARGDHLSTLAFSEATSRSQFWAPTSTASGHNGTVVLNAHKSWVTSANRAAAYVWSSRPMEADGLSTLWLVPSNADGLTIQGAFDGMGLRGNDSLPIVVSRCEVVESIRHAGSGRWGLTSTPCWGIVLPMFSVCNAACSVGLMQAAVARAAAHAANTRYEHTGGPRWQTRATTRYYIARMKVMADSAHTLLFDTVDALENGREDAVLRVLECKAAAGDTATQVLEPGNAGVWRGRISQRGGRGAILPGRPRRRRDGSHHRHPSGFHRQGCLRHGVVRMSRKRHATHGAPVAYDAKVVTIWEGFRDYFRQRGLDFDFVLYSNYERQVESHLAGHVDVAWNSPLAWLQAKAGAERQERRAEAICMRDTDRDLTSVIVVKDSAPVDSLEDLSGKRIGLGAKDSPQANLIPLQHLAEAGLHDGAENRDRCLRPAGGQARGPHRRGKRGGQGRCCAAKWMLPCIIDGNYLAFTQEGTLSPGSARVVSRTAPYDHCNFTIFDDAPADLIAQFRELLLEMSYVDPQVRPLLDLEGLTPVVARAHQRLCATGRRRRPFRLH